MSDRFERAVRRFDEANARDPRSEVADGVSHPMELLYARRLSDWVLKLKPDASEPLRLAARCQHLCRWEIPRENYPMDRPGYLRWRQDLKKFHAARSGEILQEVGYDSETIARVAALNLKRDLGRDPDCQVLEDALCLLFLEHQLADLAARTDEPRILNAIRKSWAKMSAQGRAVALQLPLGQREQALIQRALDEPVDLASRPQSS